MSKLWELLPIDLQSLQKFSMTKIPIISVTAVIIAQIPSFVLALDFSIYGLANLVSLVNIICININDPINILYLVTDWMWIRTGAPVVLSTPHFYLGDEKYSNAFTGLKPVKQWHETNIDLEPVSWFDCLSFKYGHFEGV